MFQDLLQHTFFLQHFTERIALDGRVVDTATNIEAQPSMIIFGLVVESNLTKSILSSII